MSEQHKKEKDEKKQQSTFQHTKKSTINLQMTKKQNRKTINFAINTKKGKMKLMTKKSTTTIYLPGAKWIKKHKNKKQQSTPSEPLTKTGSNLQDLCDVSIQSWDTHCAAMLKN